MEDPENLNVFKVKRFQALALKPTDKDNVIDLDQPTFAPEVGEEQETELQIFSPEERPIVEKHPLDMEKDGGERLDIEEDEDLGHAQALRDMEERNIIFKLKDKKLIAWATRVRPLKELGGGLFRASLKDSFSDNNLVRPGWLVEIYCEEGGAWQSPFVRQSKSSNNRDILWECYDLWLNQFLVRNSQVNYGPNYRPLYHIISDRGLDTYVLRSLWQKGGEEVETIVGALQDLFDFKKGLFFEGKATKALCFISACTLIGPMCHTELLAKWVNKNIKYTKQKSLPKQILANQGDEGPDGAVYCGGGEGPKSKKESGIRIGTL